MLPTRAGYWRALGVAALGLLALGRPAAADGPATLTGPQQNVLTQVALGKARTELLDRLRALPLRGDTNVGTWLTGDAELERALRQWVRARPRMGPVRLYSDGVCELDVRIRPDELRDRLTDLLRGYSGEPPRGLGTTELRAAAERWPLLVATGRSTLAEHALGERPAGWENITAEGLELARGAAEADAFHALLDEAGRLKVTNARRLREFLDASDTIRGAVANALRREAAVKVDFESDQVAVARVRIGMRELIRLLTRVHDEQYQGDQFAAADFREMTLLAGQAELTASGLATPPERTVLRSKYAPLEYNAPVWAKETRTATGRFVPRAGETLDAAAQEEAARIDGVDRLRRQVEALVIQKDVTVATFVGYHQNLKDDVVLFLSGARPTARATSLPDGGVEVPVELPLGRLWEIVRRAMKLEEVEPPPATTSAPAAPTMEKE